MNEWKLKIKCNDLAKADIISYHSTYNSDMFDDIVKDNYIIPYCTPIFHPDVKYEYIPNLSPDGKYTLHVTVNKYKFSYYIYSITTGVKNSEVLKNILDYKIPYKWINKHDLICYSKHGLIRINIHDENTKLVVNSSIIVNLIHQLNIKKTFKTIIYNNEYYPIYFINNARFKHINNNCVVIWQNTINGKLMEVAEYRNIENNNEYYSFIHQLNPGVYLLNLKYKRIVKLYDNNLYARNIYSKSNGYITCLNPSVIPTQYGFIFMCQSILIYNFYSNMLSILAANNIIPNIKYDYIINKAQYETEIENIYYRLRKK